MVNVPLFIFEKGEKYIAYTPAFDISTEGNTVKEAKANFRELATLFIDELEEEGTLNEALKSLGWKEKEKTLIPPTHQQYEISIKTPAVA